VRLQFNCSQSNSVLDLSRFPHKLAHSKLLGFGVFFVKRVLLASVSLSALTVAAFAAEQAPSTHDSGSPPPLWTDFYVGLNAGFGWGTAGRNYSETGVLGGGQFGFNYQINENFVGGIEADFQGAAIGGAGGSSSLPYAAGGPGYLVPPLGGVPPAGEAASGLRLQNSIVSALPGGEALIGVPSAGEAVASAPCFASAPSPFGRSVSALRSGAVQPSNVAVGGVNTNQCPVASSLDYLGTVRGRLGFLIGSGILAYATGGLAYGDAQAQFASGNFIKSMLVGYTAGAGLEWKIAPAWSFKSEALYYNLPRNGDLSTFQGVVARVGLNYHFNYAAQPFFRLPGE
jgi:outer membrane immunogenic protein